jgi:conjugal transfer pilus assembly protein TraW
VRQAAALALLLASAPAVARDYGQAGQIWPVIEPDLLAQIKARLEHLQASGETARLNETLRKRTMARVNRPTPVEDLVAATTLRRWHFDPTITIERDIADDKGRVIIRAGTRVNPLDTVPLRQPLVFLDGDDESQRRWATRTFGTRAKLILTKGAPLQLMKTEQRRYYFDQGGTLVRHFGIRALPATVAQQGRILLISEQPIPNEGRGS